MFPLHPVSLQIASNERNHGMEKPGSAIKLIDFIDYYRNVHG